jgi:hypothetical protein
MELVPCKIDWIEYTAKFPSQDATWLREMAMEFPDTDLGEMHDAYTEVFEKVAAYLPAKTRKSLGLFVAGTSCNYVDNVDLLSYQPDVEYDPEEFSDVPQPHLDPKQMTRVAKALLSLESGDYASQFRLAWEKAGIAGSGMESADDFLNYLALWIRAFKEIHSEGAVLGFIVA